MSSRSLEEVLEYSGEVPNGHGNSLGIVCKDIRDLFHALNDDSTLPSVNNAQLCGSPQSSSAAWQYEAQRFDLWANTHGIHHSGHSSLDYRLRDASALRILTWNLLDDLRRTLKDGQAEKLLAMS